MTLTVWRLDTARHAVTARTGEGARLVGGRWTSPGRPAIYCAEHLSLAILEILVHAPGPGQRRVARTRTRVQINGRLVAHVAGALVPEDFSPRTSYAVTRAIGDAWLEASRHPALLVPSAIVPTEQNCLLNPRHPRFRELSWGPQEPIVLDDRLWTAGGDVSGR